MPITKVACTLINDDEVLKKKIAISAGKTIQTVERWAELQDDNLTRLDCLNIIVEHTGVPLEKLFVSENYA